MSRAAFLVAALLLAVPSQAQDFGSPAPEASATKPAAAAPREGRRQRETRTEIAPYLEVGAILTANLNNGGDVLTYSTLAAGVDASIATRRAELAASIRYEHRFGLSRGLADQDVLSGLARGRFEVARGFQLEAGGLASRTRADGGGAANNVIFGNRSNVANVYSVYAGPTVTTRVAGLDVGAGYRFGYSKVDIETPAILAPGALAADVFDDSTNHAAWASVGQRPGDLPFGWQVSGGWEREDASQLDQRFDGKYVRGDVTVPISPSVALLGGVGYEDIAVSQREPLLDAVGIPVRSPGGRFVTDPASPRQLAYDIDGLIWDAGVMWQPSRRTSLTAKVGRRYGDTVYTGSLTYRPNHAMLLQVGVYDGISSFGRSLSTGLSDLPTQFEIVRNPLDGGIGTCVFGNQGSGCLSPALASATATQFRNRGIQAQLSRTGGGWNLGIGGGYDRRKLLTPAGSVLAPLNGITDENYYAFVSAARELDRDSNLTGTLTFNYFDNGTPGAADVTAMGAGVTYTRRFWRQFTGSAAATLSSFDQDGFNSELIGAALLGLRYNF